MRTKVLLDRNAIERTINRMTHEILEKNQGSRALCLIGIRTRGVYLANRIQNKIKGIEGIKLPVGVLDITMYRDDISTMKSPEVRKTEIAFDVNNMTIILVDDVIHTGRTTRAAIDAIMDLGRPKKIQLAVLVDRGDRELPMHPDYAGLAYAVNAREEVHVRLGEVDGKDEVVVEKSS
ncbi:MAG TPA: bifunctional pyr operon transcriptional regulator/uracil phosphoribosyltransferase PyrR [Syntrophorhabdaceae bacterium]|nr:bifunctional pyr operon transcriptional regulator/uracil phosphoribosyltransferase PyrR [Syntrophorhabdaceae bacterium]